MDAFTAFESIKETKIFKRETLEKPLKLLETMEKIKRSSTTTENEFIVEAYHLFQMEDLAYLLPTQNSHQR
jgi:hypothetical protein